VADSRYDFFVSYAHEDLDRVRRLDRALRELLRRPFRRSSFQVFRDERRLSAGSDLTERLRTPMRESRTLLVVLSAASSRSVWVDREIAYWCEDLGRPDHMILVRADPSVPLEWDDSAGRFSRPEALPPALVRSTRALPFYVELGTTTASDQEAAVRIAATVLGRAPEEIAGEDYRLQRRRRRLAIGTIAGLSLLTVLTIVASVLAVRSSVTAQRNERRAVADALANRAIVEQNDRPDKALALARAAHRYDAESEGGNVLVRLLAAADGRDRFYRVGYEPTAAAVSPTGHLVAIAGTDGGITVTELPAETLPAAPSIELSSEVVGMAFADEDRLVAGLADGRLVELTLDGELGLQQTAETTVPLLGAFAMHHDTGLVAVGGFPPTEADPPEQVTLLSWAPGTFTELASTQDIGAGTLPIALAFDEDGARLAVAGGIAAETFDVPSLLPAEDSAALAETFGVDINAATYFPDGALAVGGDPQGSGFTDGLVVVHPSSSAAELGRASFAQTVRHLTSCRQSLFFGTDAGEFGSIPNPDYDLAQLNPIGSTRPFGDVLGPVTALACSDGGTVVAASQDGFVQVRSYDPAQELLDASQSALRLVAHHVDEGLGGSVLTGAAIVDGGAAVLTRAGERIPLEGRDADRLGFLVEGQSEQTSNCLSLDEEDLGALDGSDETRPDEARLVGSCGDLQFWASGLNADVVELRKGDRTLATFPAGNRIWTTSVAVTKDKRRLFIGGYLSGVLYDISDPSAPQLIATVPTDEVTGGVSFAIDGDVILVGASSPRGFYLNVLAIPIDGEPLDRLACTLGAGSLDGTLATQFLSADERHDLECS
jgi:TIR domain